MAEQAELPKAGQGEQHPPIPADAMIVLPVRQTVLFPGIVLPFAIGRKSSIAAAQEAVRTDACSLFLTDASGTRHVLRATTSEALRPRVGAAYVDGQGRTGWVARRGTTLRARARR